jgi:putative transposase
MARPSRNTNRDDIQDGPRTFFVTSKTNVGGALLQTERMANLFIDVLRTYVTAKKFRLHDFVVMPNHFHLQLTLDGRKTIEKAVGLVKGNFSYRAKKELGCRFEIWQPGFSDERVWDRESFLRHRKYIDENPVKAGLADKPENYPYGSAYFRKKKKGPQGLKAYSLKRLRHEQICALTTCVCGPEHLTDMKRNPGPKGHS